MSRLDGIDISGWNIPIDVVGISADFVIVKVTEGLQGDKYNKWWRDMLDEGAQGGKLLGVYHYANGDDPVAEADSFYSYVNDYRGRVVPCLDWEGKGNALYDTGEDVGWCLRFMDRISELMGSTCLFYTSKGECNAYDWSSVAKKYPLWGAEYAYDYCTYQGYEDEPWQSKAKWGAWGTNVTIHQYGYVNPQPNNGGRSQIDADKFYGTKADWQNMCRKGGSMSLRDEVVEAMRSLIGEPYYSMNYGRAEGFGGMGTNYIGDGFGCAEGCTYAFNTVLGTRYKGSVWNFAGDALGDPDTNQGGGEFVFVSEPDAHAGDVVLYLQPGHDGTDATDYSHAAMLVDDYHVVGAWGKGVPGQAGYWPGRGVSEDLISEQDLGGGRRYVHCVRLDEKPDTSPLIYYRAHVQGIGWMDSVCDGETAGTTGQARRLEALKIAPPGGVELDVMAHVQGVGDVWYRGVKSGERSGEGSSQSDPIIGTVGQGKRIEGIAIMVKKNDNPRTRDKVLKYRCHVEKTGWTKWKKAGYYCGTRGKKLRVEAVQIKFT